MLVIEIDGLDAQAPQAGFAGLAHIVGLAVHAADARIVGIAHDAELCGQHDLVALAFDGAADEFFILVRAVDVGRVEKRDAKFERPVNGGDGFVVIASAVKLGHAHAAEAEGGDLETAVVRVCEIA